MFEKLRETLGGFREDVEDVAEEKAEEAAETETEAESESEAEADVEAETEQETEPESDEPAEYADADVADTADATGDGDATEQAGVGLGQRARSLARGQVVIDEDDLEDPLWELEMALLENDVEMGVAEAILDRIRSELVGETKTITTRTTSVVTEALREALLSVIRVGELDFDDRIATAEKPIIVIFTGVNGVGKTTTIAKVARYLEDRGYSTVLANGDTYRAGANEQLREHADRLDKPFISHEQGGDPAAVIYDAVEYAEANDIDVVLGDTAGRLHTSDDLMNQLAKIDRVVDPDLTIFVDEAVAGQDAVERAREFNDAAAIDGTILTKADADASGGAAISIAHVTGKPILFLGTGQDYDDLDRFDPEALVDRLVGED